MRRIASSLWNSYIAKSVCSNPMATKDGFHISCGRLSWISEKTSCLWWVPYAASIEHLLLDWLTEIDEQDTSTRKLKCSGETSGCSRCKTEHIACKYTYQKQMGRPRKRRREDGMQGRSRIRLILEISRRTTEKRTRTLLSKRWV